MAKRLLQLDRRQFVKSAGLVTAGSIAGAQLIGCGSSGGSASASGSSASASASGSGSAASASINLADWDSVLEQAKGSEVNLWSWSGVDVDGWYDNTLAPHLKEKFDITLNRTGVSDTKEIITQISSEMQAGVTEGSVDFLWVNGENFNSLKQNGYLWGSFAKDVPNAQYYDWSVADLNYDAGVPIEGLEMTWSRYISSFWADTDKVGTDLPTNTDEYLEMVKQFPGKVCYPEPGDSTGSRFMFTMIANIIGRDEWSKVASDLTLTKDEIKKIVDPGLEYLRELNPYLWGEGKSFPAKWAEYHQMYADGEVYASFTTNFPAAYVENGQYPKSTRCFMLDKAMLAYGSYLSIPANAAHAAAALVTVNEMCGPELELSKYKYTTYPSPLDESKLTAEQRKAFEDVNWGDYSLDPAAVKAVGIQLASGTAFEILEEMWHEEVLGKYNS